MKNSTFYDRLLLLSKASQKSMNQIERDMGLPRNALNNYKNISHPSGERLVKIANYFGVSVEYLIGEVETKWGISLPLSKRFEELSDFQKLELYMLTQTWIKEFSSKNRIY